MCGLEGHCVADKRSSIETESTQPLRETNFKLTHYPEAGPGNVTGVAIPGTIHEVACASGDLVQDRRPTSRRCAVCWPMPGCTSHQPKPQGYVRLSCTDGRTGECRFVSRIRCRTVLAHRQSAHGRRPPEGSNSRQRRSVAATGGGAICRRDFQNTTANAECRYRNSKYGTFPDRTAFRPGGSPPKAFCSALRCVAQLLLTRVSCGSESRDHAFMVLRRHIREWQHLSVSYSPIRSSSSSFRRLQWISCHFRIRWRVRRRRRLPGCSLHGL